MGSYLYSTTNEEIDKSKEEKSEDIKQEANLENIEKIPEKESNNKKKQGKNDEVKFNLKSQIEKEIKNGLLILNDENEFKSKSSNIKEENEFNFSILDEKRSEINFCESINEINKFTNLLKKLKLTEYINYPKICSIGNQSNGKTSILTNIIGLDILPKGDGVVTRRPLELRLNHIESGQPYAYFDDNIKIRDFSTIKEKINNLTKSICGDHKNIMANPLTITIFSQTCPNLTIIDLPGIVKVPVGDQPKNIEEITKEITLNYINDPYTIILCALDANQDITTSDGLYLAKQIDFLGERTLGVLTKVDLMDEGTNCKDILENKLVPLKLGYIAVKNRSKLDLINNISIKEGLLKEKIFFEENDIYSKMNKKLFGTQSLIEKLIEVYTNMFYKKIGNIIGSIKQHIKRLNNELILLGKPLPQNLSEKNLVLQDLVKNYCNMFFNLLNNRTNSNQIPLNDEFIDNEERNKIKKLYDKFLIEYTTKKFTIKSKGKLPKNISLLNLLNPKLNSIKDEAISLFKTILEHLYQISDKVIYQIFERFPKMENRIKEIVKIIIERDIKTTEELINQILKYELNYEFTNDESFLEKYNFENIIENNVEMQLENALNDYYKIIVRNIRNIIPKTIQYKLIHNLQMNLLNNLIEYIFKNPEIINELEESEEFIKLRYDLNFSKIELEKILKKLINSSTISRILLDNEKNEKDKQLLILEKEKKDKIFKNSVKKLKIYKNKQEKVEEILEDMCILGQIMKEEIIEEKKNNPEKFISIEEATKEENKNDVTFCLGILAQNLEDLGITTAIEKKSENNEEAQNAANTVLQFITNGMIEKKKFDLHFDLGNERNNELLYNLKEQEKFNNKLRKKLSIEYNIPEDEIIITNPQRGSYSVQVIFASDSFNDQNVDINIFKNKCNDKEFQELKNLKTIHKSLIMEGCKLTPDMLDSKGNRESGWGENEKRGGFDYIPPKGWKGFGLKVTGKYDNGNDDWLAYNGNPNEWAVAYHGIGKGPCANVEKATKNIINGGFEAGGGQVHAGYQNINKRYRPNPNDPKNDHSNKVGIGVYCSPDPIVMKQYGCNSSTNINGKTYKMGFMMRVRPDKIRISKNRPEYWVLDGTINEMRPYRIMIQ